MLYSNVLCNGRVNRADAEGDRELQAAKESQRLFTELALPTEESVCHYLSHVMFSRYYFSVDHLGAFVDFELGYFIHLNCTSVVWTTLLACFEAFLT